MRLRIRMALRPRGLWSKSIGVASVLSPLSGRRRHSPYSTAIRDPPRLHSFFSLRRGPTIARTEKREREGVQCRIMLRGLHRKRLGNIDTAESTGKPPPSFTIHLNTGMSPTVGSTVMYNFGFAMALPPHKILLTRSQTVICGNRPSDKTIDQFIETFNRGHLLKYAAYRVRSAV